MARDADVHRDRPGIFRREDESRIYAALYNVVEEKGSLTGNAPVIPRDAFLTNTRQHPNVIDGNLLQSLDDTEYLFALYWSLLNRIPEDEARSVWAKAAERTPGAKYRKKLSRRLSASLEAHTKGVVYLAQAPSDISSHIDIGDAVQRSMPPGAFLLYFIKDRLVDPFIGTLYLGYSRTLRPYRIRLRDKMAKRRGKEGPSV